MCGVSVAIAAALGEWHGESGDGGLENDPGEGTPLREVATVSTGVCVVSTYKAWFGWLGWKSLGEKKLRVTKAGASSSMCLSRLERLLRVTALFKARYVNTSPATLTRRSEAWSAGGPSG